MKQILQRWGFAVQAFRMLWLFGLNICLSFSLCAQVSGPLLCGTEEAPVQNLQWIEQMRRMGLIGAGRPDSPEPEYDIPLSIHLLSRNDGAGALELSVLWQTLCELNDKFRPTGIQFYIKGNVNRIPNTYYYNLPDYTTSFALNDMYNVARSINVYFLNLGVMGLCGFANYPNTGMPADPLRQGAVYMGIACSGLGNTTWAHELGHFLNLPHPFDGTAGQPSAFGSERVTRNPQEPPPRYSANCTTAGDRFCDTRADYRDNRWNCPSQGTVLDINTDLFNPDETLYMSYSLDMCANRFTAEQSQAMRAIVSAPSASRAYLMVPPMHPFDSLTGSIQVVYPPDSSNGHPANWLHIRWRRVPGATKYAVRLRRPTGTVAEWMVENGDTSFLYTGSDLRPQFTYRISVKPINHGWFCSDYSQDVVVTLSDSFLPCPVVVSPSIQNATIRADSLATLRANASVAGHSVLWRNPISGNGFVYQGSRYSAPPASRTLNYTVHEAADAYLFDLSPGPFLPDSPAYPGIFTGMPPQGLNYFVRLSKVVRWDWAAVRSQGAASGTIQVWPMYPGGGQIAVPVAQKTWQIGGSGTHNIPLALLLDTGSYRICFVANPGSAPIWMSQGGTRFPYSMKGDWIIDSTDVSGVSGGWEFGGIIDWQYMAFCMGPPALVQQTVLPNRLLMDEPLPSCVGDSVSVPVRFDLDGTLVHFGFEFVYDSAMIQFLGAQLIHPSVAGFPLSISSTGNGRRRLSCQLSQPLVWTGIANLLNLRFRRLSYGNATADWVPSACVVTTPQGAASSYLNRGTVCGSGQCQFLSGSLNYANQGLTPLSGWTVRGRYAGVSQWNVTTAGAGSFLTPLPQALSYELELTAPIPWGGVNATDALWVSRIFSGQIFPDSLALRAADVNASNLVNSTDALQITQRFSGMRTNFARPDWAFAPYVLNFSSSNPPSPLLIRVLSAGDVNGSYSIPNP